MKDAEFRVSNLQETKIFLPPSRLLRDSPKGPTQTTGLFGLVGLFLGVFAAGFVEFTANAHKYGKKYPR